MGPGGRLRGAWRTAMSFGNPAVLYGLALIPIAALIHRWAALRQHKARGRLGEASLVRELTSQVNWRGRRWKAGLWLLALTAIVLALARPQWGVEVQVVERQGVQVMVALDVSLSMLAQDLKPDRLSRAKLEIADLMNRLSGDEIGLVVFAGRSFVQFPLTFDYATAKAFLEGVQPGVITRQGTAIGDAIRTALRGFDDERPNRKVIVLMTDGEDHESNPLDAARQAAEEGVVIYAVGFGSPRGEPIPEYDEQGEFIGYKRDRGGEMVLTKLDEATLSQIVQMTEGRYFRASADGRELEALQEALERLGRGELESVLERRPIERFQEFLWVALAALVSAELIPERRGHRRANAAGGRLEGEGGALRQVSREAGG